jgi:hypothetical protein
MNVASLTFLKEHDFDTDQAPVGFQKITGEKFRMTRRFHIGPARRNLNVFDGIHRRRRKKIRI